jgi:hypothetical protein
MTSQQFFVLGADDPEMRRIEQCLKENNIRYIFAEKDGVRVHPGNAYEANNTIDFLEEANGVGFIECWVNNITPSYVIDHHRPGDPGHGKPSELYWEASSLGQLHKFLGVAPKAGDDALAAMDHCFNAALQGRCPGVSQAEVLEVKIKTGIMDTLCVSREEVLSMIREWRHRFESYYFPGCATELAGKSVLLIHEHTGVGYSLSYLTAQVAAVLYGKAVVLRVKDTVDASADRLMLCGDVTEEMIAEFIEKNPLNLDRVFGSPARGYAGGYARMSLIQ